MSNCCDDDDPECVITLPGCFQKGSAMTPTGVQLRPLEHQFFQLRNPILWMTALAATGKCRIVREDTSAVVLGETDPQTVTLFDTGWAKLTVTGALLNACEQGWHRAQFHCLGAAGEEFYSPILRFFVKDPI
jgi:hypothetical protein